ncbi:glycosyltransferase, partial [Singulisphaera rosea]
PLAGSPWVVGGLRVAERQKRWHVTLDRRTASLSVGSVCVSEGVRRFNVSAGINPDRLTVIPNGIDPLRFDDVRKVSRSEIGVPDEAQLVVYVGRLDVQKGIPFLLDAAERVAATRPRWHLAMIGDGPERASLRERTDSSFLLSSRVHWLGRRDDIPSVLKAADLLVLPSLWEGMPNVVLEAMAARRAVVATSVEGTDELVIHGQTGWLVPPKDAEALAESLEDAADHPELTQRFGESGRERIEGAFSIESAVKAYERLWAGILGYDEEAEKTT